MAKRMAKRTAKRMAKRMAKMTAKMMAKMTAKAGLLKKRSKTPMTPQKMSAKLSEWLKKSPLAGMAWHLNWVMMDESWMA